MIKVSIVRNYGKWISFILLVGVKLAQPFWREIWDVYPQNLHHMELVK